MQRTVDVYSNYFRLNLTGNIYKYLINVKSDLEIDTNKVIGDCLIRNRENLKTIKSTFGEHFRLLNGCLYSTYVVETNPTFNQIIETAEGTKATIPISIEADDADMAKEEDLRKNITGYLVKKLQNLLQFQQIGRKLFNPKESVYVDKFEIWPGYSTAVIQGRPGRPSLLNTDLSSKIITTVRAFDFLKDLRKKSGSDFEGTISLEMEGKSVMTKYNKRIYRVDKVDFNMSPLSTFEKDGKPISFMEYYEKRYNLKIQSERQPLFLHIEKKRGAIDKSIYLIPELCVMTGLTDQQRTNIGLMRKLDTYIKPNPDQRIRRSVKLVEEFRKNPKTKALMEEWGLKIESTPLKITAAHINPGALTFDGKQVHIEKSFKLDRECQHKMFVSKNFNKLVVFFPQRSKRELDSFMNIFVQVLKQYQIGYNDLKTVAVEDFRNVNKIKQAAQANLSPDVTICLWILPGRKKDGQNYDYIKRLLINEMPVPSQVILASTISAGKNLRSIITKMLVQIGAKVGAVPWGISDLPFVDKPTMIVGIDTYSKNQGGKSKPVMAMVATNNLSYSTYWSDVAFARHDFGLKEFVEAGVKKAAEKFEEDNNIHPFRIIIYREGVSEGQRVTVKNTECLAVKNVCNSYREQKKEMNFVYVLVNKINNAKFFYSKGRELKGRDVISPLQGTCVYDTVCEGDNEFYLISQKTFRGLATPTSYYILENEFETNSGMDAKTVRDMIATLSLKMSFLYYNTIGGIKVPAAIHYANKLSSFVGDKSTSSEKIVPHDFWRNLNSLYFI